MDVGPLRTARYTEPFSLVIARLAYQGRGGPELAYRFERLGERAGDVARPGVNHG